jgi:hypothetical protein
MADPKCEATKAGLIPPSDPKEFENWRKTLDPDSMGFDGAEVGDLDNVDS